LAVQIQQEQSEEIFASTNRQLAGDMKCLQAPQLWPPLDEFSKCTAEGGTFMVARAGAARRNGAALAATPPVNNLRREIAAEPVWLGSLMGVLNRAALKLRCERRQLTPSPA
jgi:hypothetical protein